MNERTRILIVSGEGEHGVTEEYTGKRTARALKSRLTRERCSGDRWAHYRLAGREGNLAWERFGKDATVEDMLQHPEVNR